MKSGKQRKVEIQQARKKRAEKKAVSVRTSPPPGTAPCNPELLAPYNSYGLPLFVERGYYKALLFRCKDCGKEEVWTATQQKWWYETAKGVVWSTAIRCRPCRRKLKGKSVRKHRPEGRGIIP